MLVPGCSPGLFTKQFVEFAPSYANITNIFSAGYSADDRRRLACRRAPAASLPTTADGDAPARHRPVAYRDRRRRRWRFRGDYAVYATGSTPRLRPPIQPHTFPYLNDKFFYSGYGAVEHARPGRAGRRLRGRRLVQDVRVLRGAQPDDRRDRAGRAGDRISTGCGRTSSRAS